MVDGMNRGDSDSSGRYDWVPMPQPWTLSSGASFAGKAKHLSPRRSKLRHTKVAGVEGPVTGVVEKGERCCCLRPAWTWDAVARPITEHQRCASAEALLCSTLP